LRDDWKKIFHDAEPDKAITRMLRMDRLAPKP
jgi:hypothetical protein